MPYRHGLQVSTYMWKEFQHLAALCLFLFIQDSVFYPHIFPRVLPCTAKKSTFELVVGKIIWIVPEHGEQLPCFIHL